MKIGITGTTCSGKTTFIDYLRFNLPDLRNKIELVTERAMECPFPLNEKGGFRTQWWIQSHQIAKEFEAESRTEIVITDRTVFDSIPYLMIGQHTEEQLSFVTTVAREWNAMNPYDIILFFAPISGLLTIGAQTLQDKVDRNLRTVISIQIPHENIVYIPYQTKLLRCENTYKLVKKLIGE